MSSEFQPTCGLIPSTSMPSHIKVNAHPLLELWGVSLSNKFKSFKERFKRELAAEDKNGLSDNAVLE